MNVGNVKEFTFSININAKLAWNSGTSRFNKIVDSYCFTYAQERGEEFRNTVLGYYDALGGLDERYYKDFCNKYDFNYHKYDNLSFPVLNINDGILCFADRCLSFEEKRKLYSENFKNTVEIGYKKMQKVAEDFYVLSNEVDKEYKEALIQHWYYQAEYWVNLFGFAIEICSVIEEYNSGKTDNIANHYFEASKFVKNILDLRKELFVGEWATTRWWGRRLRSRSQLRRR